MMKKLFYIVIFSLFFISACSTSHKQTTEESRSIRQVSPEVVDADWNRTPKDVLENPIQDEPIIWVGIVKNVFVKEQNGKIEIEWVCEHLAFYEPGPAAISVRPIKVCKGQGYFVLSLIIGDMTMEQAMKFKKEHTATKHYILVEGKFTGFEEIDGMKVPFLFTYHFGVGSDLAKMV